MQCSLQSKAPLVDFCIAVYLVFPAYLLLRTEIASFLWFIENCLWFSCTDMYFFYWETHWCNLCCWCIAHAHSSREIKPETTWNGLTITIHYVVVTINCEACWFLYISRWCCWSYYLPPSCLDMTIQCSAFKETNRWRHKASSHQNRVGIWADRLCKVM